MGEFTVVRRRSKFQAVCGGEKTLADVSDEDYYDGCALTDLMGVKAIGMIEQSKKGQAGSVATRQALVAAA